MPIFTINPQYVNTEGFVFYNVSCSKAACNRTQINTDYADQNTIGAGLVVEERVNTLSTSLAKDAKAQSRV
jgi:hypothetical protein